MKRTQTMINDVLSLTCDYEEFLGQKDKFICRQLDIFDHCLTEDEASKNVLSYPILKAKNADLSRYLEKERLVLSFLIEIYQKYELVSCVNGEHSIYSSLEEYKESCISSLREIIFVTLHIPKLGLTIYGNYDLNMPFNFLISKPDSVSEIESLLKNFDGLYFL